MGATSEWNNLAKNQGNHFILKHSAVLGTYFQTTSPIAY